MIRAGVQWAAWNSIGPLPNLTGDPDSYRLLAETLARTGTLGVPSPTMGVDPTAYRPPLYPYLLSWLVSGEQQNLSLLAVAILHVLLGTVTCVGVYAILTQFAANHHPQRIAPLGALLTAVDPLLLTQSTQLMTETLAATFAVAITWLLLPVACKPAPCDAQLSNTSLSTSSHNLRWLGAATILALGFLTRPIFVVWTALLILRQCWHLMRSFRHPSITSEMHIARKHAASAIAALCLVPMLTVVAWAWRNEKMLGAPVWATTHGGYTLLLGNNPYYYDHLHAESFLQTSLTGDAWDPAPFHADWRSRLQQLNDRLSNQTQPIWPDRELEANTLAAQWAKESIADAPQLFAYASLVRVINLWSPLPRLESRVNLTSIVLAIYYSGIYGLIAIALMRQRPFRHSSLLFLASTLALSLTIIHAVYWSNIRMRAPIIPLLAATAALGLARTSRSDNLISPVSPIPSPPAPPES